MIQLLNLPLLFSSLLFLFIFVRSWKGGNRTCRNLPPGPWKLPIIGNMPQLLGALPHRTFEALAKKHGPIMHLQVGQLSTVVISSKEVAEKALKTHDIAFSQRPSSFSSEVVSYKGSGLAFAPYGNYWRQLRRICSTQLLSPERVNSYRSIKEEEVSKFIGSISSSSGNVINLSRMIFMLAHQIISKAAFGKKNQDQDEFIVVVKKQMEMGGLLFLPAVFPSLKFLLYLSGITPKLRKMQQRMDDIMEKILKNHNVRRKTRSVIYDQVHHDDEDFVDVLLELQSLGDLEFPITNTAIKAVVKDIFVGGSENPSTTIEWAMAEMLINPEVMNIAKAEVRQAAHRRNGKIEESDIKDLSYFNAVIKETLRLHPPVPLIPRESRESCEINGYHIPVNTSVMINTWAIGRDPNYWIEPECFRPERFLHNSMGFHGANYEFVPFGAGRRICPGISFAMASIEVPLAHLLYHFDWKLPNGIKPGDVDMTEVAGVTSGRKKELLAIPIPYTLNK